MTTLEAIITIQRMFIIFPRSNSLVVKLSMSEVYYRTQ